MRIRWCSPPLIGSARRPAAAGPCANSPIPSCARAIRIEAERIDQIDHTPEVVLNNVRVNYLSQNGQNWVMFGDVARVQPGGKVVDVSGNVRLQGESADSSPAAVVR